MQDVTESRRRWKCGTEGIREWTSEGERKAYIKDQALPERMRVCEPEMVLRYQRPAYVRMH